MEEISIYTFPVDGFALRACKGSIDPAGGCSGASSSTPSCLDLARSRVRDPVCCVGSKRMKIGSLSKGQDGDWEATTQSLAATLAHATMVMIEDGDNWKMFPKV